MTVQLYLAIGVPILANAALIGLLLAYINARFDGVNQRFESVNHASTASTGVSTTCETSGAPNSTGLKKCSTPASSTSKKAAAKAPSLYIPNAVGLRGQ